MRDTISNELLKENPDWLLISNLAKQIHMSQLQTNPLGFKRGVINIIKCGDHNVRPVYEELTSTFDTDDYHLIEIGGWGGMTVTGFNKLLPKLDMSKYILVVTNKDQVFSNSSIKGYQCNIYKGLMSNKYNREKETTIHPKMILVLQICDTYLLLINNPLQPY
jgi:hypothetical protein